MPKVPGGVHNTVTKNRFRNNTVSDDYTLLWRVWIENKEILILKKNNKSQMQHYCCPQTWQEAAHKWNIVVDVKEGEAEFY